MVSYIHSVGMLAGVAIKPETSVDVLYPLLDSSNEHEIPDVRLPPLPFSLSSFLPPLPPPHPQPHPPTNPPDPPHR